MAVLIFSHSWKQKYFNYVIFLLRKIRNEDYYFTGTNTSEVSYFLILELKKGRTHSLPLPKLKVLLGTKLQYSRHWWWHKERQTDWIIESRHRPTTILWLQYSRHWLWHKEGQTDWIESRHRPQLYFWQRCQSNPGNGKSFQ